MEGLEKPFTITVEINSVPTLLDVQPVDEYFRVTLNGELVAELLNNEMWYQYNSPLIDENLLADIGYQIERHYD